MPFFWSGGEAGGSAPCKNTTLPPLVAAVATTPTDRSSPDSMFAAIWPQSPIASSNTSGNRPKSAMLPVPVFR